MGSSNQTDAPRPLAFGGGAGGDGGGGADGNGAGNGGGGPSTGGMGRKLHVQGETEVTMADGSDVGWNTALARPGVLTTSDPDTKVRS